MDERNRILEMLAEGKLTVEEATMLLDQTGGRQAPPPVFHSGTNMDIASEERLLRVRVYVQERDKPKPTNVTINIPLKAARIAGNMIHTMIPHQARASMAAEGIDLTSLDLVGLIDALAETGGDIVNVVHDDDDEQVTVKIYVE